MVTSSLPLVSCVPSSACTVAGSAVIDFSGKVLTVPDRCGYTLLSIPGLKVLGVFRERWRKDVSFPDHLVLKLDNAGVEIIMEQSRVLVRKVLSPCLSNRCR